jgi:hypothetical protein
LLEKIGLLIVLRTSNVFLFKDMSGQILEFGGRILTNDKCPSTSIHLVIFAIKVKVLACYFPGQKQSIAKN